LTVFALVAPALVYRPDQVTGNALKQAVLLLGIPAFILFTVGLAFVGAPAWWLLHRLGRRSWFDALLLGFFLTFVCSLFLLVQDTLWLPPDVRLDASDTGGATITNNKLSLHGWMNYIELAASLAPIERLRKLSGHSPPLPP